MYFFTFVKISYLLERLKPYHSVLQFFVLPLLVAIIFFFKPKIDFTYTPPSFKITFWIGILLMPLNWLLEYLKWKVVLKKLKLPEKKAIISFASGVLSEFVIPGIPSNFIGRIFYFEKKDQFNLSVWIQIANLTQFTVTLIFGIISLFYLNLSISTHSIYFFAFLTLIILLFILIKRFNFINLSTRIQSLTIKKSDIQSISILLVLSLLRFLIFSLQFGLILHSFSIIFDFQLFTYIWISYLFVSFSPSLFLGNFMVRESVTVSVFQLGNYPIFPILYAAFIIWILNNFLPVCLAWCYSAFFKKSE